MVAVEGGDTCAIDYNGLICWGGGHGSSITTPTLSNPTQIGMGEGYACALDDNGVTCWGQYADPISLLDVPELSNPYKLTVGDHVSCALDDNGSTCWGSGLTLSFSNPTEIAAGYNDVCAIEAGDLICDGGNPSISNSPSISNPIQVDLSYSHACALNDNGITCWGSTGTGDEGNMFGEQNVPNLSNPTQVSVGNRLTCAIDDDGVTCWGKNYYGQTDVPNLANPTQVAAGSSHACALDDSGITCWGNNNYGQLDVPSGLVFSVPDTAASVTGATSTSVDLGGLGFGTLIATDIDGLTDGSYFTISTPPVNGQALINAATGNWIYTANNSFIGVDPFTVTVTDDLGGTTEQVVSITITAPDSDGDGTYDFQDNCPSVFNADQANLDGDAFGDACDADIDGDGTDNAFDAFPNDPTESADSDADNVGDNSDNCVNDANADQANLDGDELGDTCDPDMDGDGYANVFEVRFGGDETDNSDAAVSLANAVTFSETAPADSDLDGVPDDVEAMLGEDNTSSTFQDLLDTLSTIATAKNVPAMGGIGLLALGLSMLGLGAVRLRKN